MAQGKPAYCSGSQPGSSSTGAPERGKLVGSQPPPFLFWPGRPFRSRPGHADLSETSLRRGYLASARLDNASLAGADLRRADFYGAQMAIADLSGAFLEGANLTGANLEFARLAGADLRLAFAVDVNLRHSDLSGCQVYGISAWNVALESADQRDLIITLRRRLR
jgi:uncharacterized protein YjbI with pentapeptide repeats